MDLYVWVGLDPTDQSEQIVGYTASLSAQTMPLMAFGDDLEALKVITQIGRNMHAAKPRAPRMRLLKFTLSKEIEVLDHVAL